MRGHEGKGHVSLKYFSVKTNSYLLLRKNGYFKGSGAPMNVQINHTTEDKLLKLELRLAQLEKNDACKDDFLTFV